jgi:hypothetical protein
MFSWLFARRRLPFTFGAVFVVIGIVFGALAQPLGYQVGWAGVTMLLALGVAMALLTYILTAGVDGE